MNEICRTCLRSSEELTPLFGDTKLLDKIKIISSIEILHTENLPTNVCAECIENINMLYDFRRVIIDSDQELRARYIFKKENQSTGDDDINREDSPTNSVKCEYVKEQHVSIDETIDLIPNDTEIIYNNDVDNNDDAYKSMNETPEEITTLKAVKSKMKVSKENKLYECDKCEFKATEYIKWKRHSQNHEVKICNVCGKFISATNMNKHLSIHTDAPVICEECGKICKNAESLRGHLILHKGINRTCRICGAWFKERATYIAHRKIHQDKKNTIQCQLCDKMIDRRSLKKHIRSHTGERPYPCEICNKGFSSSNALKTHRRQHTNERPYKCTLCSKAFPQKISLSTHLKSKHQTEIGNNNEDA